MSERRPSVVLVTRNLPPLVGGMERLNSHLVLELARSYDVTVVGPSGVTAPGASRVLAAPSGKLPMFLVWAAWTAAVVSWRTRPQWVFGGSGLVAPIVVFAAWLARARSGLYLHGLDVVAKHPLYRAAWLPAIRRVDLCFANSTNTRELAAFAGVKRDKLEILFPGVEPHRVDGDAAAFRQRVGAPDEAILLSVGRLTARKGMAEFVGEAFSAVLKSRPSTKLVVIGDDAPDALLKGRVNQRARIVDTASAQGILEKVVLLGSVNEATLSDALAAADVHVFPVMQMAGDVEGFGMVAVEAAAAGVPTVAYAVGGVPDAVSPGESGVLVSPGDHRAFGEAILEQLASGKAQGAEARRRFAAGFDWKHFGERLRRVLLEREAAQ